MADRLQFKFSHHFNGTIWNTISHPEKDILLFEIRDQKQRKVSFSAFQHKENRFLWQDFSLEEAWWVNLAGVAGNVMLFTIYLEQQNPDRKGLLAYDINDRALRWWHNDFSLAAVYGNVVSGMSFKTGQRELLLDLVTGETVNVLPIESHSAAGDVLVPIQYQDGSPHFGTVKTFLKENLNLTAVLSLEYLETGPHIFISYYATENGLANYLLVLDQNGEVRLHEKLDEHLKGIGLETFFVLSGCVFFVKNRVELVSYFL